MSDEESSSASDVDYIPSDAEDVSVEENSGDEENLGESGDESLLNKSLKRKRKTGPALPARKRRGGIRLEDELPDGCEADPETLRLDEERRQKQKEQMVENLRQHEEKEKRRSDSLWQSFLSDVGSRPTNRSGASGRSSTGSLTSLSSPVGNRSPGDGASSSPMQTNGSDASSPIKATTPQKVTVTKVYDFAGEEVKISKEVDANSKEAKEELSNKSIRQAPTDGSSPPETGPNVPSLQGSSGSITGSGSSSTSSSRLLFANKRPGGGGGGSGLGGLLNKIGKKPKISTLDKSKLDWDAFKHSEGIESELVQHNRSKHSYLERMAFLDRTDHRQFQLEKALRQSSSSSSSSRR